MSNKMLIDASHPEETRVAVVRGNRIEEYDFESQEKKQLRGNIYLAKVTRVEPSLQAAFVDYGGNRHGFLAFSEIHPDYYQIPVADRQALIEAEAEDARASREAEDAEDNESIVEVLADDNDDASEEETPKKKSRRRRSRKSKAADENVPVEASEESSEPESDDQISAEKENNEEIPQTENVDASSPSEDVQEEKPKRRSTRRKKAPIAPKAEAPETTLGEADNADSDDEVKTEPAPRPKRRNTRRKKAVTEEASSQTNANDGDEDDTPTTMAAMVEMDSISEPLPEDADEPESNDEPSETEEVAEKPKRRYTRRKAAPKKAEKEEEEPKVESEDEVTSDSETSSDVVDETTEEAPAKPKKRAPRKNSRKKKEVVAEEDAQDTDADDNSEEDAIESVGQEDALEEVPASPRRQRRHYKIQEVIKRRQVLLVQVAKEERGNKGAALTTYLSLAGRYSVLMPNTARGGGISRKITNAADRKRLKAVATGLDVPQGMGVILRTAGASRTNAEIERDFDYLMRLWEQVRNLTLSSSAPCLVYEEGSLIKRSIRDLYDKDTGEVIVAGEDGFKEAKDFMTMLMPTASKKVKLHRDKQAIFAKFGVETQLDKMVTPQVTLKSGGYLIIDQTEALVAVDVNSGRSTREHSIENTALQTNLEAAEEVARQLRLRDLAGLIVIDFIDMEEKRNNRAVEKKLKDSLKNDRARIQVGRISHFGLMEMSRQRMRASVLESTMDVCSLCAGTGHVRSDSAIALHVFRAIEEHVSKHNRYDAVIKTTPAIAIHLLNHKRAALLELENRYGLAVLIEGSTDIKGQEFVIEKGELASGEVKSNAVGYQNSSPDTDDITDAEETGEKNNRGRKRGRGRRNNQNDDNQSASEEENSELENAASEEDDDQPRKKRRRGKRGGKRRTNEETTDETAEVSASENEPEMSSAPAKAETSSETAEPAPVEEEKPKSRSTTRRKAPIAKPVEAETAPEESSQANASEATSEQAEKPKPRRTTRRKKADEVETEEPVSEASAPPEPEASSSSQDTDEKPEGEKKKKGWWNRGGGFF